MMTSIKDCLLEFLHRTKLPGWRFWIPGPEPDASWQGVQISLDMADDTPNIF